MAGYAAALVAALADDHGDGAAMTFGGAGIPDIKGVIPTGSEWLDQAIGRGGFPLGLITLLSGAEGSGKTTLCLNACAAVQQMGGIAYYIDSEYRLDLRYAGALGVDVNELAISQPMHIEQGFTYMESAANKVMAIRKKLGLSIPLLVVLDSMNSLLSKTEVEGDYDNKQPARQAAAYSKCLAKIVRTLARAGVSLILVSQHRERIGVMFGAKVKTAGGNAPRFYSSCTIALDPFAAVKDEDGKRVGNRVMVQVTKNSIAPPFRECQLVIRFGEGIDDDHALLNAAKSAGLVKIKGSWMSFGKHKWQGETGWRKLSDKRREPVERKLRGALREGYSEYGGTVAEPDDGEE